jgi:hypothetical protein
MAKVAAAFYRHFGMSAQNTAMVADAEAAAYAFDGLARATASCPALTTQEYEEWVGDKPPDTFNDATVIKFLTVGNDLMDSIEPSSEKRAEAADRLERAGEAVTARRLLQVLSEMRREVAESHEAASSGEVGISTSPAPPTDQPGEEQSKEDFGETTSNQDLRPASLLPGAFGVVTEPGTSGFVLQFSDPGATGKQPESW